MDHDLPAAEGFPHRLETKSAAETRALGARVAELLRGGEILLLHGPLGAGKTCFCQGVGAALGMAEDEIVSPTFTLINTHAGRLRVHHLDFYRLGPRDGLIDVGVPEVLDEVADGDAVALVEWPGPLLPLLGAAARFELLVLPGAGPDDRCWHLRAEPPPPPAAWTRIFAGGTAC